MPTYGDPNMVGYRMTEPAKPVEHPVLRYGAAAGLGVGGGKMAMHAVRPNVAGRIAAADKKVEDVDRKLANVNGPKMSRAKVQGLERERKHVGRQADIIRRTLPTRQTKTLRLKRGLIGTAALAGAATLAKPLLPKKQVVPSANVG